MNSLPPTKTTNSTKLLNFVKRILKPTFYIEESMGPLDTGLNVADISPSISINPFTALDLLEDAFLEQFLNSEHGEKINEDLELVYNSNGNIWVVIVK